MGTRFSPTSPRVRPRTLLAVLVTVTVAGCTVLDDVSDRFGGSEPLAPRPAPELEKELPDEPRDVANWIDQLLMEREGGLSLVPNLDTGIPLPDSDPEVRLRAAPLPDGCPRMPTAGLGTRDSMPTVRLDSAGYPIRVAPLCTVTAR